jgi:hypothetical protein
MGEDFNCLEFVQDHVSMRFIRITRKRNYQEGYNGQ